MRTFGQIYSALRRKNRKNYTLLTGCNLFSVMLITAYISIMRAPTVLSILPEGGDSRKQMMAIFALAVVGCGVFTTYSASLFFRSKSKEMGILMALGTSLNMLKRQLTKELMIISIGSCLAGAALGTPLAWCIWQVFRVFIIDTKEMTLTFDPQAFLFAGAFSVFIIVTLFLMGTRFIHRTNIMDIVNEQRKSEPIHDVRRWYGTAGIALIVIGGFGGYIAPSICITMLKWYPPAWINILYLPLFIGVYMVLMHTIVNGWRRGKNRYRHIITHSMMKFQGRQTVNNMLVITILLAGAYFAVFYIPMLGTAAIKETELRPMDYAFHYRADENMLTKPDIEKMALEENVTITSWQEADFANLARDGKEQIEDAGGKYHYEYRPLLGEGNYISESEYNRMSGQSVNIQPGHFDAVLAGDGSGNSRIPVDASKLTNMVTNKVLDVKFQEYLHDDMMAAKYYVLDDEDYAAITVGLTDEWHEKLIYFNVKNVSGTYAFAKRLYNVIIDHSAPECEIAEGYDRVQKFINNKAGKTYSGDTDEGGKVSYAKRDSSEFKLYWRYAPKFRVLDRRDFVADFAVYLMVFAFVAVICFAAVLVIGYTRCITIAIINKQVYEDIKHLGASQNYLYRSVRGQIAKVYGVPAVVGTTMMYCLYVMIMFFNDNRLTQTEAAGLMNCFIVVVVLSTLLWLFYCYTLKKVCRMLKIVKS